MTESNPLCVQICVIGAGIGGLTTALALARRGFKYISVYEHASDLGFVGAGIQLAPNMARILDRLGVWQNIEREATNVHATSIRQGATGKELGHIDLSYITQTYGYPHMVGHRANLADSIYEGCKQERAVTFFFGTTLTAVHSFGPSPRFDITIRSTGETQLVQCDLLIDAGGIKSFVREQMLGHLKITASIVDTGQAAYRIMLRREDLEHDQEMLSLLEGDTVTRWIGEKRHIIAYPVANKTIYNMSSIQPDRHFASAPSASYTTKGSKIEMLNVFDDFCPLVKRLLNLVDDEKVCEWRLRVHEALPTWVCGQTTLVGDACHPTLPHLGQGAAQAIEDAAVLAVVLTRLPSAEPDVINKALRVYEAIRKDRAYNLVTLAAESGRTMHLGEGAAKQERDRQFAALASGTKGSVPDKWADADVHRHIYGVDVVAVAETEFDRIYASL